MFISIRLTLSLTIIAASCVIICLSLDISRKKYDYDLVVIGAGASGMFAAGTASSFGRRTLLIEKHDYHNDNDNDPDIDFNVGGDCSNAACVPSKAIRAAANLAATTQEIGNLYNKHNGVFESNGRNARLKQKIGINFASVARRHAAETVQKVRERESPAGMAGNPNLDLIFTPDLSFNEPHVLRIANPYILNSTFTGFMAITPTDRETSTEDDSEYKYIQITAKQFIIATGASPVIPSRLFQTAKRVGLPLLTYRSLFRPDREGIESDILWNLSSNAVERRGNDGKEGGRRIRIVIAGGGPTACEIAQSLVRLYNNSLDGNVEIFIVAPSILPAEDVAARAATRKILQKNGVKIIYHRKVVKVLEMDQFPQVQLDDASYMPADILICAVGREAGRNLKDLGLDKAGIKWSNKQGILVNSHLQSVSMKHIYACGDAASAVELSDRRASHAGWTGYHAVQSAILPKFLLPEDTVHPFVPRVTFLHPEVAAIGMTRAECVKEYGHDGFQYLQVDEIGTDRSDIDAIGVFDNELSSSSTSTQGFVELRVSKPDGKILGATAVSTAASEIINEIGLALCSGLTVRDIARSLHTYPSYGYLMHRVSLSLAMNNLPGALSACGPTGRLLGWLLRTALVPVEWTKRRRKSKQMREWEAMGTDLEIDHHISIRLNCDVIGLSYFEASADVNFCKLARQHADDELFDRDMLTDFIEWLDSKPPR